MTVKQLIEQLQAYDPNKPVFVCDYNSPSCCAREAMIVKESKEYHIPPHMTARLSKVIDVILIEGD